HTTVLRGFFHLWKILPTNGSSSSCSPGSELSFGRCKENRRTVSCPPYRTRPRVMTSGESVFATAPEVVEFFNFRPGEIDHGEPGDNGDKHQNTQEFRPAEMIGQSRANHEPRDQ